MSTVNHFNPFPFHVPFPGIDATCGIRSGLFPPFMTPMISRECKWLLYVIFAGPCRASPMASDGPCSASPEMSLCHCTYVFLRVSASLLAVFTYYSGCILAHCPLFLVTPEVPVESHLSILPVPVHPHLCVPALGQDALQHPMARPFKGYVAERRQRPSDAIPAHDWAAPSFARSL